MKNNTNLDFEKRTECSINEATSAALFLAFIYILNKNEKILILDYWFFFFFETIKYWLNEVNLQFFFYQFRLLDNLVSAHTRG